jgi:formate/nitrite transporter FocA (FNT family)
MPAKAGTVPPPRRDGRRERQARGTIMANRGDGDGDDEKKAEAYEHVPSSVIFEAIRREGEHELSRRFSALWWSGVAAGLAISTSVLCKGFLTAILPDAAWAPGVSNLGYTVGFLIVILGRMQLFTENTITPILPLFLAPTRANFAQTARLWGIVFVANLVGCAAAAAVLAHGHILPDDRFAGVLAVSRHYAEATALEHFVWGVPAGFIIAALVWILPRMDSAGEILMIVILTYMIGLGDLSHVVAGSTELFLLVALGELAPGPALFGGVLPAFAGNVLGGTGIFAALTYAQVRNEL